MVVMEEKVTVSYDEEFDTLYLNKPSIKSRGSVEIGDFVVEFSDEMQKVVAIEILNASRVLSGIFGRTVTKEMLKSITSASFRTIHTPGAIYIAYGIACSVQNRKETLESTITVPVAIRA